MTSTATPFTIPGQRGRYLIVNGRLRPFISGGDGPEGGAPPADPAALQAAIDAAVSTAVEQAKRDAYTGALAKLGTTDLDAAAAAIKAKNEADAANQSEIEKAQAAQRQAEADRDAARTAAEQAAAAVNDQAFAALVRQELIRHGHPIDGLDRTSRLIDVAAGTGADQVAAAITTAVKSLAADVPALFAAATGRSPAPAPGVIPPAPPAPGAGAKSMEDLGREVAARNGLPVRPLTAA